MMPKVREPERFESVDEALSVLMPKRTVEQAEPMTPPEAQPWPDGDDVAFEVFRHVADELHRAVERADRPK
jgi:hypothetical protein